MTRPAPLYIVTSSRPRMGKTLIARLMVEFLHAAGRPLVGYDLNPRDPILTARFPSLVWPVDISNTRGQMELFDRLIADGVSTKVVDLGSGSLEQFFAVMGEIGFMREARRRSIEPVVLFVTDTAATSKRNYVELIRVMEAATLVPVHNEAVSLMLSKEDFPPSRADLAPIHIPRLSPIVRGVIERPNFSFTAYMARQPGGPTEIHQWVAEIFTAFRELELRLLMGRLSSSLAASAQRSARRE